MKKTGRVSALLRVLAHVAQKSCSAEELAGVAELSRTAFFRLLVLAKEEFRVELVVIRGVGYRVADWGVLNPDAVVKLYGDEGRKWTARKRLRG